MLRLWKVGTHVPILWREGSYVRIETRIPSLQALVVWTQTKEQHVVPGWRGNKTNNGPRDPSRRSWREVMETTTMSESGESSKSVNLGREVELRQNRYHSSTSGSNDRGENQSHGKPTSWFPGKNIYTDTRRQAVERIKHYHHNPRPKMFDLNAEPEDGEDIDDTEEMP